MYIERLKLAHCQQSENPTLDLDIPKKEDNMPLRIYNINKTKKPDDKKTVYLSDQSEKQETEKEIKMENGEKNGQQVKIFLKITVFPHIRPAGIIFL